MTGTGAAGVHFTTGTHPLALLSTLLNFDRHGDAVYSQEELDRVISQLVEQNMGGTAPPPASQNAISSLPKKPVDKEMLGHEGKAECSICMDPVEIGTEVTVLPCTHWFHYNCIEMWLNQHNTCPHCRRPIDLPYVSLSLSTFHGDANNPDAKERVRTQSSSVTAPSPPRAGPAWRDRPTADHDQGRRSQDRTNDGRVGPKDREAYRGGCGVTLGEIEWE